MSATSGVDTRDVVPRWRDVAQTLAAGELPVRTSLAPTRGQLEFLELRKMEWHQHRTETYAIEFVGTALMLQQLDTAADALAFLTEGVPSPWASEVQARQTPRLRDDEEEALSGEIDPYHSKEAVRIAHLRRRLAHDPRAALTWSELGRCYTAQGLKPQAERAIRVALALAPNSRYLLRNAACFYIHTDRPDQAHSVLTRADATSNDPWLVAAELATAHVADVSPHYTKRARLMVDDANFSNFQLTELASQLATLELGAAAGRRAKRLFDKAMLAPNDNSLAQTEWASHRSSGINVTHQQLTDSPAAEARSLHAFHEGEWGEAFVNALAWQQDQLFSLKAAMVASFAGAVGLMRWQESFAAARIGLRIHRNDAGLLNNAAYPLVEMGKYAEARTYLGQIAEPNGSDESRITAVATKGLLAFRTADVSSGRAHYARAILLAHRQEKGAPMEAMANVMLAREEVRIGSDLWRVPLAESKRLSRIAKSPGTETWIDRVEEALAGGVASPNVETGK
jgi:Tfp pilus assembly protein PilF